MKQINKKLNIIVPSKKQLKGTTKQHSRGQRIIQKNGVKKQSIILLVGNSKILNGNISQNI